MIPLRDDQPSFSTPFINYFLIVLNSVVFLWELSVGHRALGRFITEFGVIPHHTLVVLTGHSAEAPVAAILPLFTSMFLHISFWHIAGNMLFLWIFGDNVEDYLGHFHYLLFYLVSGLAADFTYILLNANSARSEHRRQRSDCRRDGRLLHSLPARPRAGLVSANFLLSCAGVAHVGLLVSD